MLKKAKKPRSYYLETIEKGVDGLLALVEQRQTIAEGEEDVGGLAECLGFAPLGVSHRGLESAVAVQDVVPSDTNAGTFTFEEPIIGSERPDEIGGVGGGEFVVETFLPIEVGTEVPSTIRAGKIDSSLYID